MNTQEILILSLRRRIKKLEVENAKLLKEVNQLRTEQMMQALAVRPSEGPSPCNEIILNDGVERKTGPAPEAEAPKPQRRKRSQASE